MIGLLGTNYKKTSIKDMEPIFFHKDGIDTFLKHLPAQAPVQELVVLTTCNRMEFYFVSDKPEEAAQWLINEVALQKKVPEETVSELLTLSTDEAALNHLYEVASGVDSMVFGENEILTQVKDAHDRSLKFEASSAYLNKVFQSAIATGKRVRSETKISRGAYSVSSIAIEAIREQCLDYFGRKVLILGVGVMGHRSLKKLAALGHPDVTIANRTYESADRLAKENNVNCLSLDEALTTCHDFDIIISATSTKDYLLKPGHFPKNAHQTSLIIDLGVPRNVNPEIQSDTISIITMSGLRKVAEKNIHKRKAELDKVMEIISDEKDKFNQWLSYKKSCVS